MKKEYDMLKEVKRLKSVRGYGTQLITIYVPAGYQLNEEISKLKQEHSESGNIKSKSVRTNVQDAIDKIIQYLRLFREVPKNGLAVFCGNISTNAGKVDIELFSIEPPVPLNLNVYRCDSSFFLEPIEEIIERKDVYILLVMDGREATVATLKGSHIQIMRRMHSMAHAKMKKGGQSAGRFSRAREEDIGAYYVQISEAINDVFLQGGGTAKGLIIGGPGPTKEYFDKAKKLNYQIKMLGMFDTGYTDETGLNELVVKALDLLKEQEAAQERKYIERFVREIAVNGLAVYGYDKTKEALESNKVSVLLINKDLEIHRVKYKCSACSQVLEKLEYGAERQEKHEDGGTLEITEDSDAVGELVDIADKNGVETVFVSAESPYGKEFLMGFKGIGALLRYK